MSLTLGQLREKVESFYPDVQQINDTVLRYTRKTEESAFAVYYLDIGADLPQTPENLHDYLDRIVGERYFDGASSLQWNNYLFFIRGLDRLQDSAARKAKELVEQDRTYARKFVISESELDSVLRPKTLEAEGPDKTPDANSHWISILQKVNLVEAVFGEHTLPERIQLIDKPTTAASEATLPATTSAGTLLPPIRQFKIKDFHRRYPIEREFHFGDVNLLFGANGTGKTSLLEAIELFYCGKTRRNPKAPERYKFEVSVNGKPLLVSHNRAAQPLRNHNLAWYGVREQKSTNLYDGFGRFNFLNTDAAIELSQSSEHIDDDLARLLVGSDAAKTWQIIEKLSERVGAELRGAQKLHEQVRKELDLLNKQIADIETIKKESDSLRSALREKLRRNQWTIEDDQESEAGELIAVLAELNAVAERAKDFSWLNAPVSLEIIESYSRAVESIVGVCSQHVDRVTKLRLNQRQLVEAVRRDQEAMTLIDELSRLVESGVEQRVFELARIREIIAAQTSLFAGVDEENLRIVAGAASDFVAHDYRESAIAARKLAKDALSDAKREYGDFVKQRDRSLSLAQELRAVAALILEESPADQCPLCHTKFQPGELAHHMAIGVDEHLEARAQKLLEDVRSADTAVSNAAATERAANQIVLLCERMQLPPWTMLKDAIERLNEAKIAQAEARKRVEELEAEIRELEAQGLSLARLNEVSSRLDALGIYLADQPTVKVKSIRSSVEQRLTTSRRQIAANEQEERRLQAFVSQATQSFRLSEAEPLAAMAELSEQLAATRAVSTALKRFLPRFGWEASRPIVEWMVEAEAVRGIAAQLQAAIEKERVTANTWSDISRRRDALQKQNSTLAVRINRLDEVQKALTDIQTEHSLKVMTESALKANRRAIETIFAQIHSPGEFKAIGPSWTLIRKHDGTETPLTMISTGQRAAFALALFLAQNAQLRAGPRVILIDDPIAHVDDLNCLSFLDYLREIALTGTRQVFFATASDKLAGLFERKFDFFGERFKRFNLTRANEE